MITWRTLNRWGWLLAAGTVLTTVSLAPIFADSKSVEWLGWLDTAGAFVSMAILRPSASSSEFMVAGAIGFIANTLFLAVLIQCGVSSMRYLKRRRLAQPKSPAASPG